jgi:hypothetical protein
MGFLEAMRSLTRFVDVDDPEVVAEFGWMLVSAPPAASEVAASLWALLAHHPVSVEIWAAANRVLGAVELEDEGAVVGEELLGHLTACPLHAGQAAPLAVGERCALGPVPMGPVRTCSFRVLPVALLERVGAVRSLPVTPRRGGALIVDERRVDEARYRWPVLASSLAPLAAGAS